MPGGYGFLSNDLSGPKIGSLNLLAIFDLGPLYLAIFIYIDLMIATIRYTLLLLGGRHPLCGSGVIS